MSIPSLTLRQLVSVVGALPPDTTHDVAKLAPLYDFGAQVRGFLIFNRYGVVREVRPLVFRFELNDVDTALDALQSGGVDLDQVLQQGELSDDDMRAVYLA